MLSITRLAWMLLVLALVGAVAGLFGPHERVWGIDLGATGTAVFGFTLWTGAWLFARYPDAIFPREWSVAERRAWAGLVFLTLVSVSFVRFMIAIAHLDAPPVAIAELPSRHFIWNLIVLLIAWAVVAKTLRGPAPDVVELDERDLRMQRSADRAGDWALTLVVIAVVLLLAFVPAERLAWWLTPLVAANVLLGLLIGRTFVEHAFLVARYALERR
jgi:fumarate reductase subunit C